MHLETLWRWRAALMALAVGALAAMLRFPGLGYPTKLVFDEVYYARGAYSLATLGFEGDWTGEDQAFAQGDTSGLDTTKGDYVVHPLLGKLMIAAGIQMFGPTPFGWRFMAALTGTVTVILIALVARHLFRSTIWGTMAGVLLAIEGQHIVMSRTALLDIFLTFFVVVAFGCLLLDRTRTRSRLLAAAASERKAQGLYEDEPLRGYGPPTGIRWWRFAAIVALGLGASVKWSGLYVAAAFLVVSVLWDLADRKAAGYEQWHLSALMRAVPAAALSIVTIPAVYLATWIPWFRSEHSYGRQWAQNNPGEGWVWLPESLRSLVNYHEGMLSFHRGLDSPHNYEAHPLGWLIQWRPTAFHFQDTDSSMCATDRCVSAILAVGHPMLWWTMVAVLGFALWRMVRHRDIMALTVSVGMLASWLPWIPLAHRTVFTFYTVSMAPFVVLMVVWAARHLAQPERLGGGWSRRGTIAVIGFVAAALLYAGFYVPVWTGQPVPYDYWQIHMFGGHWT